MRRHERGRFPIVGDVGLEQVARDAQVDGTGRPVEGVPGGLADELRDMGLDRRLGTPLRDRGEQRRLVELLVFLAEPVRPTHRRGEGDDRAARPVRLGQAAGHVGGARAVGPVDERRSPAEAGVAIGHVDRGVLAPGEDLADPDGLEGDPQAVVTACHQEEVLDTKGTKLERDGPGGLGGGDDDRGADRAQLGRGDCGSGWPGDDGSPIDCSATRLRFVQQ